MNTYLNDVMQRKLHCLNELLNLWYIYISEMIVIDGCVHMAVDFKNDNKKGCVLK